MNHMLRSTQEKEQLVRKFEEILPVLKNYNNFGWIIPDCEKNPVYEIFPDVSDPQKVPFRKVTVNIKTGWHSEFVYRDDKGVHRIKEGVTPIVTTDWVDVCYRGGCVCRDGSNTVRSQGR